MLSVMISSPVYLQLVSLKQNAEEEAESYLSMSVYFYEFWIMLVLIQLEATALRVNYSYNSISASLDVGFFQKCSNGVSASCSTSCRRRGKIYASFGYFFSTDLTYYINRMKFILCYWVLPQVPPAERQMLSRKMRWEEKPQAIICLLQEALPFAAQKL